MMNMSYHEGGGRVNTLDLAEFTLEDTAVAIGILTCFINRLLRNTNCVFAATVIAFSCDNFIMTCV